MKSNTVSKLKKKYKVNGSQFDYHLLRKNLNLYKELHQLTYEDLVEITGLSSAVIVAICTGKYSSDLSVTNALMLCDLMVDNPCKYIKK